MPMSFIPSTGAFLPHEIAAMRAEFDAGSLPDETAVARDERAAAIFARHQARKAAIRPPQA